MNIILRFIGYKDISTASIYAFEFRYYYSLIEESKIGTPEEEIETKKIYMDVEISEIKAASWQLIDTSAYQNLIKILFEYGKRELIEKVQDSTIERDNKLRIYSNTHPEETYLYNPDKIIMEEGQKIKISIPDTTLNQRVTENNLAFLIITKRDEINALFKHRYKDKLFLITQERNLLEFFRSAESIEEFSFRITALGNLVGSMNKDMLSKETSMNTNVGTIQMLELLLSNMSKNQKVTTIFKNLILLRKAYPVHGDNVEGVIEAHKYFGLEYPIRAHNESWNKIKSEYYYALNELFVIVEEFET